MRDLKRLGLFCVLMLPIAQAGCGDDDSSDEYLPGMSVAGKNQAGNSQAGSSTSRGGGGAAGVAGAPNAGAGDGGASSDVAIGTSGAGGNIEVGGNPGAGGDDTHTQGGAALGGAGPRETLGVGGDDGRAGAGGDSNYGLQECQSCTAACVPPDIEDCSDEECAALLSCAYKTGCAKDGDIIPCYCGTLEVADCFGTDDPNVPQGPCKAFFETAAGKTLPNEIAAVFFDGPIGAASEVVGCKAGIPACVVPCNL